MEFSVCQALGNIAELEAQIRDSSIADRAALDSKRKELHSLARKVTGLAKLKVCNRVAVLSGAAGLLCAAREAASWAR